MLIPSRENIEKIFRIYQNQCSFSTCKKQIIDSDRHVNGNIIFIESNKKEHLRYNPKLTDQQMMDYTNLIMFCDVDCWNVEKEPDRFTGKILNTKLNNDLKNLADGNFELSDEMYEEFLHHFINYHDPDRFTHFKIDEDAVYFGYSHQDNTTYVPIRIKPTKHFVNGKFEIIDTSRKIQEFDKVIFYPKEGAYSEGIQADIEIKSAMNIHGKVPNLPKGDYYVSIRSALNESSKLENNLKFTVL